MLAPYLFAEITDLPAILVGPSNVQSEVLLRSKRQVLQINSFTSPHSFLRAVTLITSSPLYQSVTFPEHFQQLQLASSGFENHTRLLKR